MKHDVHNALCRWGVWYDSEFHPERYPEPQPWARKLRNRVQTEWLEAEVEPPDDEFMEEVHAAWLRLSNDGVRGWTAACILAAHYRDWRLSDRTQPQPFVKAILNEARREFRKHWNV